MSQPFSHNDFFRKANIQLVVVVKMCEVLTAIAE